MAKTARRTLQGSAEIAGLDIAGLDNGGLDNGGLDIDGLGIAGLGIAGLDIARLDIDGLDNDGRMCGQVTELKLQKSLLVTSTSHISCFSHMHRPTYGHMPIVP